MVLLAVVEKNVVEKKDGLISYGKRSIRMSEERTDSIIKKCKKTYFSYIGKTCNSDIQNSARDPAENST